MKALTICQPYAELIARGDKPIENRNWTTPYRGVLAIHAGKSRKWLGANDEDAAFYGVDVAALSFGAIVALAILYECVPLSRLPNNLRGHAHAFGPYCWLLTDIYRLSSPVACGGAQGLWTLSDDVERRLIKAVAGYSPLNAMLGCLVANA